MKSMMTGIAGLALIAGFAVFNAGAQTGIPTTPDNQAQILNLGVINTPYSEYTPYITPDEHFLFFQSDRPDGVEGAGDFDLWYSENEVTEGVPKFKPPVNVGLPVNSAYFDGHPSLRKLPSGDYEMYFCSFALEGREGPELTNIYYTIMKNGKWSAPVPIVEINTDFHDRMPSISQDGHYLFFSSDRPGGFGRDDIWVSEYDFAAKRWGKPVNAGRTINTPASEVTPAIHSDNITLYFSSDRPGGVGGIDIYVTQMIQGMPSTAMGGGDGESMWKKPLNLGKPYNSTFDDEYPTVIRNGNYMYFASNREGGQGKFDIFRAKVPDFAKPEVVVTMRGRVKEKFSEKGIEANIRITDADGERNFSTQLPEGLYSANLINKKQYKMVVTAPGYAPIEYIADLRDVHTPITIQKDFEMERALAFPKELTVNITFVNEKGATLKPNATYRLSPDIKDDTILPFKKSTGVLKVPLMSKYKKPEDALAALEQMQLSVAAKAKGYEDLAETRMLTDLMRGNAGEMKDTIDLKLTMKAAGSTPTPVDIVDCKAGNGCVAIAYFSTNVSSKLNNEKAAGLKKVVELWNKEPHKYVYVYGHTDSRGTPGYNMKLARSRAAFVKRRLVQYGIPAEMIITKSFGETKPASKEDTAEGRRLNRRAEIYFDTAKRPGDEVIEEKAAPGEKQVKPKQQKNKSTKKKPAKNSKPLPPEEVEPSAKENNSDDKTVPGAEGTPKPKPEAAKPVEVKPVEKQGTVEEQPFSKPSDKPGAPMAPPNTEIKVQ
ncbi:MAG: PD40 domain-containing protein [Spirochaetes bacterium]|nr:PD40 domain-containing protein [Spirochaetota bacterium]